MGIPILGPSYIYGSNMLVVCKTSWPELILNKKSNSVYYQTVANHLLWMSLSRIHTQYWECCRPNDKCTLWVEKEVLGKQFSIWYSWWPLVNSDKFMENHNQASLISLVVATILRVLERCSHSFTLMHRVHMSQQMVIQWLESARWLTRM